MTKNSAEEKEKEDNEVQTQVKPPPNYSIQKPLHFVTKESNLSPMKKPSSEGPLASKLRKENQIKQEKKNPPQVPKQFYQINSKNMYFKITL